MTHLTQAERYEISAMLKLGTPKYEIAASVGKDPSTIYRELQRNSDGGDYRPELAQGKAQGRHREKNKHRALTTDVRDYITKRLEKELSPEQIKGRADREGKPCVSHERIYQLVWRDKKDGGGLYLHLRSRGRRYQKRGGKQDRRGHIPNRTDISQRPGAVEEKDRIGDLEIDLVMGKGHKGALLTINDRATGVLTMGHVKSKGAGEVERATIGLLDGRRPFIRTITSDNGREFANHENIAEELAIDFYFARPYHSWERGANENLNGLVRQYFPKGTGLEDIDEEAVKEAVDKLNNRPRKRFGYRTPNEVQAAFINKAGNVALMA